MAGSLRAAGWRPLTLAVLVLAVTCWPSNQASTEVSLARPTPADVVAVALVGYLLLALMRPGGTRLLRGGWLIPAAAIAGTAGISVFVAASPVLALAGYARFLEIFVLVPVAVAVVTIRLRDATALLGTILAVGAVQAAVGITQYLTRSGAGFGEASVRAIGTFGAGDALAMGNIMASVAVILLAATLCHRGPARLAATIGLPLAIVALVMSLTRGAILAFAISAAVVAAASRWQHLVGLVLVAMVLVIMVLGWFGTSASSGSSPVASRLASIASAGSAPDQSVQDRYGLWRVALDVWRTDPLWGVGIKNFANYRDTYAPLQISSGADAATQHSYLRVQLLSPHNQYLLILAEQGLPGLAGYLAVNVSLLAAPTRLRRAPQPATRFVGLAALGIAVQLCIVAFYGELNGPSALFGAVCMGLCLATGRLGTAGLPATERLPGRPPATPAPGGSAPVSAPGGRGIG